LAYVSQSRVDQLDQDRSVLSIITDGGDWLQLGESRIHARAYLAAFNFKSDMVNKPVSMLSGGERNRLQLATVLKQGPNVIFLDEPTNDLDVDVLRKLENALSDFAGCAVVISHDRWFLDRICTHILAFEGDSHVVFFQGNYNEYEESKKARLGKNNTEPSRIKYRKLERI